MPTRLRPPYFAAGEHPSAVKAIEVDEHTTPRKMVMRTIFAKPRLTLPAAALMIGHQVGEAMVPVVMGVAIDRAVATGDTGSLLVWLLVLAVVFAALSLSFRFGLRIGFLGMNTIQHHLRTMVTDRILDPRGIGGASRSPGMLLSIATADVTRLAGTVWLGVLPIGEVAAIFFCGFVLLWVSWPLGLAVLIGAPVMLWLIDKAGGPLRRRSGHEQQLAGEAAGSATDLMTGFRVVKGIDAGQEAAHRYQGASGRALVAVIKARRTEGAFVGAMQLTSAILVIAVGIAAGLMAVAGSLTIGQLISVVGVTQFVIQPLGAMGKNFGAVWAAGLASAERVLTVLQAPSVNPGGQRTVSGDVQTLPPLLRIDDLSVGPITHLSFTLPPEAVTVLKVDGATAATLAAVLSRAKKPDSGTATVDGVDVFTLDQPSMTRLVRVAPQGADLFEGSLLDNVVAADTTSADGARIDQALLAAACDEVIDGLPEGRDTLVGEAGRLLSGGQRQRVALARALASDSEILVLVDPNNAVDSVTESVIAGRMSVARAGRATLVISSSPAFLAAADHIIDIEVPVPS
ncbi:ABC transporter ATP-binding protein [Williamsia sp. 1135]|uniref:ABC transporter transmembrane domain-containing protein n=1 Tax=Williamsia sp. 1135 TaxID=1889262 RepID=UPI00117F7DF2|nr:ABC transporter ATP-binding protein [Williamsia sp. 1135]